VGRDIVVVKEEITAAPENFGNIVDVAKNVKIWAHRFYLFLVSINLFLESQNFELHFNNILLSVKYVLLSLHNDEIHEKINRKVVTQTPVL